MLDLKYDFITSAVSARLTRRESATASGETFYSRIGTNHAFLNAVRTTAASFLFCLFFHVHPICAYLMTVDARLRI